MGTTDAGIIPTHDDEAPSLADGCPDSLLEERHWYCLYTKPRMEYRVWQAMMQKGIESFLPESPRTARDKRRGIRRPFFPRYLFSRLVLARDLPAIRWTPGFLCVLSFGGVPAVIDNEIIAGIKQALERQLHGDGGYGQFARGDRVRVVEGPFKNLEGVFDRKLSPQGRVRILLEFLRRTTPCIVDAAWLVKIEQ